MTQPWEDFAQVKEDKPWEDFTASSMEPEKSEGLVEDFLKPLGKAAVRVPATIVGGLGSSMVGGVSALGAAVTQPVRNVLYGTKIDPLTAANTELERWGKKTQYVQTPEEEQSLNYIMKVMKPVEMAGEGLAGLAELATTGDSQKATDVIEGRSAGSNVVSKALIPAAATFGQTSALFGIPAAPKRAVGVKNIVRDVMYEKSGLKGIEGVVEVPKSQPPVKPISDPWLKDRLTEASLQETLRPKEIKPQGTYWDYLDQMGKAERWSAKEAMRDLPEEVRKSYERDFAPELPEGSLNRPAEIELPSPEQLSGFDQLKLETLRDTDPVLWNATDKVFMEKLGEKVQEPIQGAAEKPELFVPEQYGEAKTPEKLTEAYRPSGKSFKEPVEPPTTFQEVWEAGTETTEKPGFTITDKRTFKNILDDVNTAVGKEGKIGNWERSPESLAARERLKEDLKRLNAKAKLAGKDIAQYLKDVGMSDEAMLAFARLQRETRDQKAAEQRGDFVADRSSYVPSRDTRSATGYVSKIDMSAGADIEARTNAALSAAKSQSSVEQSQSMLGKVKDKLKSEAGSVITAQKKPFYSKLEEVINRDMKMNMPVEQLRKMAYNKGVTVDEWNDAFAHLRGKVTKGQLLDELAVHGKKFEDVVLGEPVTERTVREFPKTIAELDTVADELGLSVRTYNAIKKVIEGSITKEEAFKLMGKNRKEWIDVSSKPVQFEQYSEPGHKPGSYREMFVTAPDKQYIPPKRKLSATFDKENYEWVVKDETGSIIETVPDEGQTAAQAIETANITSPISNFKWQDGHAAYSDIQNPVVRIRFNERDVNGKKVLFVEEIQGPSEANQAKMPESLRSRIYDIGVKRVVSYAKENGFDEIAWTNGKMQADRYDLSKHIDRITYWKNADNTYALRTDLKNGDSISSKYALKPEELPEWVGKETANKIISDQFTEPKGKYGLREGGRLENLDLKVGGEGLKRLYDEVIPGLMEKYGGGKVKKNSTEINSAAKHSVEDIKDGAKIVTDEGEWLVESINHNGYIWKATRLEDGYIQDVLTAGSARDILDGIYRGEYPSGAKVSSLPLTEKSPSSFTMYSDPFGANAAFKASKKAISELSESAGVKKYIQDGVELADDYLGAISTRLGNISPEIKYRLRNFEFNRESKITRREKAVLPLFKAIKKMSKEDRSAFDIARKNGRTEEVNAIASKYGVQNELANVRQVLDELYNEARKVGFNIKRNPEYHPREVTDFTGLMEYLHKTEGWTTIDTAIKAKEQKLQRYLTDQEKVKVVNSLLRGYATEQITLSKPGQLKARVISEITPELDKFYADSDSALLRYITDVTDIIEARRLFGRTAKKYEGIDIDNSIGAYIIDLKSKGKLSPAQERELTKILKARFHEVGTSGVVGLYKNLAYIDTMGSAMSAVTQVGDAAFSIHKYGLGETVKGLSQAVGKKSRMTREDLGISRRIASEFSDKSRAAKAVDTVFRSVGLTGIDSIFKSTAINAAYNSAVKLARNPKTEAAFRKKLEPIFEKETDAVMEEFKNGEVTENTKLYVFNEIADIQPITLSEMPLKYLTGGNGRIFYMLKTYTTKMFDVYRNEVFNKIKTPGQRTEGIKNLISLTAALVVMNTGADVIKDLLFGRPVVLEDHVVDNIWRTIGASRYTVEKAKRDGIGSTLVQQILPPTKAIDAAYKDIKSMGDGKGSELVQSIPVFGKFYYWWFGKGADKSTKIAIKVAKDRYYKMAMEDKANSGEISQDTISKIKNDMRLSDSDLDTLWERVQIGDDNAYKVSKMSFEKALKEFEKASIADRRILGKVLAGKYDRLPDDKKAKFDPEIERILAEEKKEPLVDVSKLIFGKESVQ